MRLVSGAHAFPSPPAPAQPHDGQLHVGTPSPPHRPVVRAPPPSPPPAAPPPGVQRARARLQLHGLSGLQRADGGLGLETQLQRLRLFGLQRPGLVAFPSAVTSCVCLLLHFQRSMLFVVGGIFFPRSLKLKVETLKKFICEKTLKMCRCEEPEQEASGGALRHRRRDSSGIIFLLQNSRQTDSLTTREAFGCCSVETVQPGILRAIGAVDVTRVRLGFSKTLCCYDVQVADAPFYLIPT